MRAPSPSPRSNHLFWLVLLVWVLLPATWGATYVARSRPAAVVATVVVALVLACALATLFRLSRTPGRPSIRSTVVLGLVGATTLALGLPSVADELPGRDLAVGLTLVAFGLALLTLAVREGRRTAARSWTKRLPVKLT